MKNIHNMMTISSNLGKLSSLNCYSDIENYEIVDKIGRGKYSNVYSGVNMVKGTEVAVKIFKPVKKSKIKREVKILNLLKGGPNIIEIQDVIRDSATKTPTIITEFINQGEIEPKNILPQMSMSIDDIKHYILSTLKALEFAHSKEIIHRDVKPHNILYDKENRVIKLADWGQAEFYDSEKEMNTRVGALFYKAPELLLGYPFYDKSIDIWALG
jgi:casein kinase II subunit alpha